MVQVKRLSKSYGAVPVLEDISFELEKGKIYGLLGPNGAGKSTLMNILTGYIEPDGGEVLINGTSLRSAPLEAKKHIGYLPEVPPLYGDMTVREYLDFSARLKKMPKPRRVSELSSAMESTGITDAADRLVKNLSKGYRQRVGLAGAILGAPRLLILDEPSAGLDPKQMAEMREIIKSLSGKSTVLVSSHLLWELESVCHELLLICRGRLLAKGTAAGLNAAAGSGTALELSVLGGAEKIADVLKKVPAQPRWTLERERDGVCTFTVHTRPEQDVREAIFRAFARADCPILEMKQVRRSLEELFLELTDGKEGGRG